MSVLEKKLRLCYTLLKCSIFFQEDHFFGHQETHPQEKKKSIEIGCSNTFECTMRNCIAQRRDGVVSADKQSKTMDIWGDLYRHLQILGDTKVKVNESEKCC